MRELMNKLGYSFKDEELLRRALTRRSAIEERVRLRGGLTRRSAIEERVKGAADNDYQSLEFVGDAALKPVVTFLLFKNDPRITQSSLDEKVRPLIANDGVMLRIARELNIDSYLIKGEGEREVTDKMRVDAVEAILGAVYLDSMLHTKGKKSFIVVIQKLWSPFMELGAAAADRHGEGHVTVAAPAPVIVPKSVTTGRAKEPHTAVAAPKPRLAVPAPVPVAAPPLLSPRGSRLFCSLNMAEISVEKFEKIIGEQDDVNRQNIGKRGDTPLITLCRCPKLRPDKEIPKMRVLLAHGALWTAKNREGKDALEVLREKDPERTPESLGLSR